MNSLQTFFVLVVLVAVTINNAAGSPSFGSLNCGRRNEEFSGCDGNPMCQRTCDNLNGPIACTRSGLEANSCYSGCVCKEGYVRVVQGDQCIPIAKCEGRVKH